MSLALASPSPSRRLLEDNRGAVMLTGLFMSFFLVGALWFVIGIGDAVVFRDRMQEAADHAAFSSAALHAKGMNFISACNLVMLVMVIVHIVLGIIHDFALAACILSLGAGCGGWVNARKVYTGYASFMKPVLTGIHLAETVAGYGYPWIGTIKGYQIGSNYGNSGRVAGVNVIAVSPSNIPGAALGASNTGLPVEAKPMDYLCEKVVDKVWRFGKSIAEDKLSLVGKIFSSIGGLFGGETIEDIVKKLLKAGVKLRYCNSLGTTNSDYYNQFQRGRKKIDENNENDRTQNGGKNQTERPQTTTSKSPIGDWKSTLDPGFDKGWGQDGPMVVNSGAENGKRQFHVYAMNFGPSYKEDNEKRVTLGQGPTARTGGLSGTVKQQRVLGYFAQAEFYYDCDQKWGEDHCNGDDDNAMFSIKWRARLRRIEIPNLGELVANFAVDKVLNAGPYTDAKGAIDEAIRGFAQGPLAAIPLGALADWLSGKIGEGEGALRDLVVGAAGNVNPLPTSYH